MIIYKNLFEFLANVLRSSLIQQIISEMFRPTDEEKNRVFFHSFFVLNFFAEYDKISSSRRMRHATGSKAPVAAL